MASSVCWFGHVLWREDGHVLRWAFDFEADDQRKKGWPKRKWRKHAEVECVEVGLRR